MKEVERRKFLGVAAAGVGGLVLGTGLGFKLVGGGESQLPTAPGGGGMDTEGIKGIVPPGKWDEYYAFTSGGQSGEIRVVGVPSMRELMRVPVFNFDVCRGWGIDDVSRNLLNQAGGYQIGDLHHPMMSYTNGLFDGRYVFANDKENGRVARIRLDYFVTDAIVAIPNVQAVHGVFAQRVPKTGYVFAGSEFRIPQPNDGRDLLDPTKYYSLFTAIDGETMEVKWQVLVDGNNDLVATDYSGKYAMTNCYNSEGGVTLPEMTRADKDWTVFFHLPRIEEAVRKGNYKTIGTSPVPVIDGRHGSDYTYYVPVAKNPHGIDVVPPSYGNYAIANGKLSPTCTVIDLGKIFVEKDPNKAVAAVIQLGLGPLHTTFDGRGNCYTTLFVDSQIVKWNLKDALEQAKGGEASPIVQKLDVQYQPGHNNSSHGDDAHPRGDYLISFNKFAKDRFLPVGPLHPDNHQLIDISGHTMRLISDTPDYSEAHNASIVHQSVILPNIQRIYNPADFPNAVQPGSEGATRVGANKVVVKMTGQAPDITPWDFTVNQGDEVTVIYTNLDTIEDLTHGLAVNEYNINMDINPGETKSVTFVADRPGVYWYYCSWFCHALHLEMRGRMLVQPQPGVTPQRQDPADRNGLPGLLARGNWAKA